MIIVVDASVAAKWYLSEDHTDAAEKLWSRGFDLHAPNFIFTELGNVLLKKCRAGEIDLGESLKILDNFRERNITFHSSQKLLRPALIGAASLGQTVYDWIYLALAASLNTKLITADRRFFTAIRTTHYKKNLMWIAEIENH